MTIRCFLCAGTVLLFLPSLVRADVSVIAERNTVGSAFDFKSVPPPAVNDAAANATFTIAAGDRDQNGGALPVLNDGRVPRSEDQPSANFFFRAGTDGGRLQVDLGGPVSIKQVNTYSWHTGSRAPQVYKLYGADGGAQGFNPLPGNDIDPLAAGWKLIASVDTRSAAGDDGGQHGVSISESTTDSIGRYRHLLFAVSQTEDQDAFGNTFYSEIDVIDANGPAPTTLPVEAEQTVLVSFDAAEGNYRFTIDATSAPDLKDWAETKLKPVVQEWYPKLVALLPSDDFEPAAHLTLRFRDDMGGTPASAGGARINLNSDWFRKELDREARGAVVHEMVHVVQNYGRARRMNPSATRTPGWLVEGIADYIRWFLFEPETKGAEITQRNLVRAKHDASYRITGNFLDWVVQNHDRDIVRRLNAAAREGRYSEQLWQDATGKSLQQLGDAWKQAHEERIKNAAAQ